MILHDPTKALPEYLPMFRSREHQILHKYAMFCTYCGQKFSRAEHLDRHVMTHLNIKPFKCATCHFSFKRRDLLQRHNVLVHRESEDNASDHESKNSQRRPIACVSCARAKTKCDKTIPSCSRCTSKGLLCEARCTKRSNDAAYRLAKRQLSLYRRPVPIAPGDNKTLNSANPSPTSFSYTGLLPGWNFAPHPAFNTPSIDCIQYAAPQMDFQPPETFQPSYASFPIDPTDFNFAQPSPGSSQSSPSFSSVGNIHHPSPLPSAGLVQTSFGYQSDQAFQMRTNITLGDGNMYLHTPELGIMDAAHSLPPTPRFHELQMQHGLQNRPASMGPGDYNGFS